MIIKKYSCRRFAGLKDKNIEFKDGLNVILGPNEAGKSTLVEGIHTVLFKQSKLGNNKKDKDFKKRFMPLPSGDSIDGELIICKSEGDYSLKREWGALSFSELETPNSDVIKDEDLIQEVLSSVLNFGQGTYSSLFFAKQSEIKESIENIMKNEEESSEISTLLRKTIMELDGISIEKLGSKIDEEIKAYFSNWDIERNYPRNGRGISDPFKKEIGKILESFYKKELVKVEMDRVNDAEDQFKKAADALKIAEVDLEELKIDKESMEKLEEDVTQRLILEPQISQLTNEITTLSKINQEWPQNQMRLTQLDSELSTIEKTLEELETEKVQAKSLDEKNALVNILKKVDTLKEEINTIKTKISSIKPITKEDIADFENSYNEMLKTEAMIKAGVIIGQLNYYNGDRPLLVTKDLDEASTVNVGESFKANGFIKLECEDVFEIEFKTGEQDFKELREKYEEHKKNYEDALSRLEVESIAQAKISCEELRELKGKVDSYNVQINNLLEDKTYDELIEKLNSFGDLSSVRGVEVIENEIKDINGKKLEKISEKRLCESNIAKWSEMYGDISGLFEKVASIMMEKTNISSKLNQLKPLPEEFESAESFRKILAMKRTEYDSKFNKLQELRKIYHDCERNLPDITYEELLGEYNALEKEFSKNLEKGHRLLKIKAAFDSTKEKMDENSFTPVVNSFTKYIEVLTDGNYKSTDIDDSFNISISKGGETTIPLDLLSSGTYDSVALALRLAILEHILGKDKGFLILDDCLVDLDPCRKEIAIKLINEFAAKHQVIFTTCSPDTATLLGGNLIEM